MRIVPIIQCRMESTRLPGKAMLSLAGKPALQRVIERVRNSFWCLNPIVATYLSEKNIELIPVAHEAGAGIYLFDGDPDNVLERIYRCAKEYGIDVIVEITADCPLIDPDIMDDVIERFISDKAVDYASNVGIRSFPDGLDVQVYSFTALDQIRNKILNPIHVGWNIMQDSSFRCANIEAKGELKWPDLRITLDTPEDYALIDIIWHHFRSTPGFTALDVVRFLKAHPNLLELNRSVKTKAPEEG